MKPYPQMSDDQLNYLAYIRDHPGCYPAEIVRVFRRNPKAGHKWIYNALHRLNEQGMIRFQIDGCLRRMFITAKTQQYFNDHQPPSYAA